MQEGSKLGTPGHSLALRFELELQEQEGGVAPSLSSSRVNKCLKFLDEIIPHLGVYQRVMQLVKREINVAIYSSEWTGKSRQHTYKTEGTNLMPLPYFVIAERLTERKAEEHSKLKAEISSLKEQLYTCEADLEKALSSLDTARHDLKDREAKLHHITTELRTRGGEKEHLQEIISHHQHSKERLCQEFDFRLHSLHNAVDDLQEEKEELQEYKVVHDQLQECQLLKVPVRKDAPLPPATSENELEQQIATTEKLKLQLLTLQNTLMDELDSWLQSYYSKDIVLAEVVHRKKKTFRQKISSLSTELCLLDKQQQTLSGRKQQLSSVQSSSPHTALVLPPHPLNPLIPQEQITSKYSAMIYTSSDGGRNFYPLKAAHHCLSCDQKTVLCPHKVCEDDLVIQLPANVSHLKISRPSFQLIMPQHNSIQPAPIKVTASAPISQGLHSAVPDFGFLWGKFYTRFHDFQLIVPRNISRMQLLELVEQLYATLLLQDDQIVESSDDDDDDDDDPLSFYESLFEFMFQHYAVKTLAPICCHAFISSLEEYYSNHKELLLLSHALCGDLDGCGVRYALLQASLVQAVNWTSHSQFPTFLMALYPGLGEEAVEQLSLNYISHSDNQLSAQLVLDFMHAILLAHKDPLVAMLEGQLTEQPCRAVGCMLEAEFSEAMEKLIPGNSDLLSHRLFLQSLISFREKKESSRQTLPTRNLAYIAAYLYRSSRRTTDLKEVQALGKAKQSSSINASQQKTQDSRRDGPQELTGHIMDMDTVRKLAHGMKSSTS